MRELKQKVIGAFDKVLIARSPIILTYHSPSIAFSFAMTIKKTQRQTLQDHSFH